MTVTVPLEVLIEVRQSTARGVGYIYVGILERALRHQLEFLFLHRDRRLCLFDSFTYLPSFGSFPSPLCLFSAG